MAFVIAPLVIVAYGVGLTYGPVGVAVGFSTMMMALTIPMILWAVHGSVVQPRDMARAVRAPAVAALIATALAFPLAWRAGAFLLPLPRLVLGGGFFFASYVLLLLYPMGQKDLYLALYKELRGQR